MAFDISPENLIPPSAIMLISLPLRASLMVKIAVIWGTPIPAMILVVQIDPGPVSYTHLRAHET